jgi:hypothetical protein
MDTVRVRQATLEDLALLLQYRRAMAEEMDGADEPAVNRMIAALEPYLRATIPEGRRHSWIAEPGGCGSVEIVQWVPGGWTLRRDVLGFTASASSPPFGVVVLDASSPRRSLHGVANADLSGSICKPVIKAGRLLYESLGFVLSSEASNFNEGRRGTPALPQELGEKPFLRLVDLHRSRAILIIVATRLIRVVTRNHRISEHRRVSPIRRYDCKNDPG